MTIIKRLPCGNIIKKTHAKIPNLHTLYDQTLHVRKLFKYPHLKSDNQLDKVICIQKVVNHRIKSKFLSVFIKDWIGNQYGLLLERLFALENYNLVEVA